LTNPTVVPTKSEYDVTSCWMTSVIATSGTGGAAVSAGFLQPDGTTAIAATMIDTLTMINRLPIEVFNKLSSTILTSVTTMAKDDEYVKYDKYVIRRADEANPDSRN